MTSPPTDTKEKYGIECDISHKQHADISALGYHYQSTPKVSMLMDMKGDVLLIEASFHSEWKEIMDGLVWGQGYEEHLPSERKRVLPGFHDESIFYAHDWQKKMVP